MIGEILVSIVVVVMVVVGVMFIAMPVVTSIRPRPFWASLGMFAVGLALFAAAYGVWLYR